MFWKSGWKLLHSIVKKYITSPDLVQKICGYLKLGKRIILITGVVTHYPFKVVPGVLMHLGVFTYQPSQNQSMS